MTETHHSAPDQAVALPLASLFLDDANVRAGADADDKVAMLAASIASVGLLSPLVVVQRGDKYGIVAGRRRWLAISNHTPLTVDLDAIPCIVIDEAKATEASLAENYAREQMTTRQLYTAFLAMQNEGASNAAIGDAFGYSAERVQRILRLATLDEKVRNAWFNGDIDEKVAQAYASTTNLEIQRAVFNRIGGNGWGGAGSVREAIRELVSGGAHDSVKLKIVGLDAYREAGGRVEQDLFSDAVTVLDGDLLSTLYAQKLEALSAAIVIVGPDDKAIDYRWLGENEMPPETEGKWGWLTSGPLQIKLTRTPAPADRKAYAKLEKQLEKVGEKIEDFEDEDDPKFVELQREYDAISAKMDDLCGDYYVAEDLRNQPEQLLARKLYRSYNGTFDVSLYYPTREAAGIPPYVESEDADANRPAGAPQSADRDYDDIDAVAEKKAEGLSKHGFNAVQEMFADSVALQLREDPSGLGLAALLFGLARNKTRPYATSIGNPKLHHPTRGALGSKVGRSDLEVDWLPEADFPWAYENDTAVAWDGFLHARSMDAFLLERLGAALLGASWSPLQSEYAEKPKPMFVRLVAETAIEDSDRGVVWAEQTQDRIIAAVKLMSHKARKELLAIWGVGADVIKTLKKDDSAAFVESVITSPEKRKLLGLDEESEAEVLAWVPKQMEVRPVTRPPAPEPEPVEEPKAKRKAKKPADADQLQEA